MTVIVAVKKGSEVYIGCDTLASTPHFCQTYGEKLVYHKNFIIGFCGSFRGAQVLEGRLSEIGGEPKDKKDVIAIAEFIKKISEEAGISSNGGKEFPEQENGYILATKDAIYSIEPNYQVLVPDRDSYLATGSGIETAYGALYALTKSRSKMRPQELITTAIEACIRHTPRCGGEAVVRKLLKDNTRYLK